MAVTVLGKNQDIDYLAADFNSIIDDIITFATINYGSATDKNRLWTNFNNSSHSRTWAEIVAFVSDLLMFYLDQRATQANLQTATIRSSIKDIAKQFGFVPATAQSASGVATFTVSQAVTIPRGFIVASVGGVQYYVRTNTSISGISYPTTGTAEVLQGIVKTETFTAKGLINEEFDLAGPNVILDQDNTNINDISPQVAVNGNDYTVVESFILQNGTDSAVVTDSLGDVVGGGGRAFLLLERPNGTPYIRFGDGIFGRKLIKGESIVIVYRTDGGSKGNIESNNLTTLVSSLTGVTSVTNLSDFSGGSDEQTVDQLRDLIPASLRSLDRAVAEQDYSDLLKSKFTEVLDASTEVNTTDVGVDLNIYVIPQGSTVAAITSNTPLYNKLVNYIDRRKPVTIQFQILDAYGIDSLISLEVFIENNASKANILSDIQTALVDYFNLNTGGSDEQGIRFAEEILLKDIDTVIKTISGITRFEIKRLSYRPRIDMTIRGLVSDYVASPVEIFSNVSESEWLLAASGTKTETAGTVLFNNPTPTSYTYNSTTGKIQYASSVDLTPVSSGDNFRGGAAKNQETDVLTRGVVTGLQEITDVTCINDELGLPEITKVTCKADVAGSLRGSYFILYEEDGSVGIWYGYSGDTAPSTGADRDLQITYVVNDSANTIAMNTVTIVNGDANFIATQSANIVTITLASNAVVSSAVDYSTGFTIQTLQKGVATRSLDGKRFDIYDNSSKVKVWFDTGSFTPPAPGPSERNIVVSITAGDSAATVAAKLQIEIETDVQFSAVLIGDKVRITDVLNGYRTDAADITAGFTISIYQQGVTSSSLQSKYFRIYRSPTVPVILWFNVDGGGIAPSVPGDSYAVDIDTVLHGTTAEVVAGRIAHRITTDLYSYFSVVWSGTSELYITTTGSAGSQTLPASNAGTSEFTVTTPTYGVAAGVDYPILSVDNNTYSLYVADSLPLSTIAGVGAGGSIRNAASSYEEFTCFKKLRAEATNLSEDSITDTDLSLTIFTGSASNVSDRVLIDNTNIFIPNYYSASDPLSSKKLYLLVDSSGNLWEINSNTQNCFYLAASAKNDASVDIATPGTYKIIKNYEGKEVLFNGTIFTLDYNSENTFYSIGAQFNQIGTIGDPFEISSTQYAKGKLGVAVDLISFNNSTRETRLNGDPDLTGINLLEYLLVDSSGKEFNLTAISDRVLPSVAYGYGNKDGDYKLTGSGDASQLSQSFKITEETYYSLVKLYLKRTSSASALSGYVKVKIVGDDGTGLPDTTNILATSIGIDVTTINTSDYEEIVFSFVSPPSLEADIQYHIVLSGDANYSSTYNASTEYISWAKKYSGTYSNGKANRFDGLVWINLNSPDLTSSDFIFEVSGSKTIVISGTESPTLGPGATLSTRYYDDNNEISLTLGISEGTVHGNANADAYGRGYVGLTEVRIDNFVFRTSPYADDIVNLRSMEIPQLSLDDLNIQILGGIE